MKKSQFTLSSQFILCVTYRAGRAGPGWADGQSRSVRVPFIGLDNALETFKGVVKGEHHGFSGLPLGTVPDAVWVQEYPGDFPGHTKIHASFRRAADGVSLSYDTAALSHGPSL